MPTDDGKIFHGSGVGDAFGPRCFKGDIMGCGIMFPRDYILEGEGERPGFRGRSYTVRFSLRRNVRSEQKFVVLRWERTWTLT